jgi:hypothetical protein
MTIPLFGFVRGDSLGLIVLVDTEHTIAELAVRAQRAAAMRVAPSEHVGVYFAGERLAPELTVAAAGLTPLDRVDIVPLALAEAGRA